MEKSQPGLVLKISLILFWFLSIWLLFVALSPIFGCGRFNSLNLLGFAVSPISLGLLLLALISNLIYLLARAVYLNRRTEKTAWEKIVLSEGVAPRGYTLSIVLPVVILILLNSFTVCLLGKILL